MTIDSHQHFWSFNSHEFGWMGEKMGTIKKDHLPSDLQKELKNVGFEGSVAVQARQTLEETQWLLALGSEFDFIKGVVGWVDLCSPGLESQLEMFKENSLLKGVRHVLHDEPDDSFMLRTDFLKGISLLSNYRLTYDLLVFPKYLPKAVELVKMFPNQLFVLDHIAKPNIREGVIQPWAKYISELAQFPNVYCKLSGMVTEADWKNWRAANFFPYLDVVFETFGTSRTMIGSDWPVCKVAGDYKTVIHLVKDYIQSFSESEKNKILGETACAFYHL